MTIQAQPGMDEISIHALREEGDPTAWWPLLTGTYFYPRPPRGGRRRSSATGRTALYFYPRPPRGGRRTGCRPEMSRLRFLSTPSARRATPRSSWALQTGIISIHALREEGDPMTCRSGGARYISIHALREEGDSKPNYTPTFIRNFYPRPPRGGRRAWKRTIFCNGRFLSTPSARRATDHARLRAVGEVFLSTPSARRATEDNGTSGDFEIISIHALREEGDPDFA